MNEIGRSTGTGVTAATSYYNTCPTCLARPFRRCRSLSKGRVTDTHAARLRGEWPERCTSTCGPSEEQCHKETGHDGAHVHFGEHHTQAWGNALWPTTLGADRSAGGAS